MYLVIMMRERDQYHFRLASNKMAKANPCVLYEDTSTSDFEARDPELGSSESEEDSEVDENVNETQDENRISWLVLGTAVGVPIVTLTFCLALYLTDKYLESLESPNTNSNVRDIYYFLL